MHSGGTVTSTDSAPECASQGVATLLADSKAALPCWVHFAVADLWVGHYIATDAAKRHMPRLLMAPVLFLAMMFGPSGLGAFLFLRSFFKLPKSKQL